MHKFYVGVTGLLGTGKDTVANMLSEIVRSLGAEVSKRNLSDEVRAELVRRGRIADLSRRAVLIEVANELRENYGEGILAKHAIEWYRNSNNFEDELPSLLIIVGIRNPGEVVEFRNEWGKKFLLVSVEANDDIRFLRLSSRDQYKEDNNFIKEIEEADKAIGISDCTKLADWSISNNGTIKELQSAVHAFFDQNLAQGLFLDNT